MIQRIQTIYIFLAALALSFMFFAPLCSFESGEISYTLNIKDLLGSDGTVNPAKSRVMLIILGPLTMLSLIFMLLSFKNRNRQAAIGRVIYLLLAGIITSAWFFIEANADGGLQVSGYGLGYFAPVVALPFVFLANRAIKKDQDLIKSLDRLR